MVAMTSPPPVSRLDPRQTDAALAAVTDAFADIPPYDVLLPRRHRQALGHALRFALDECLDRGLVEVTHDERGVIDGVAAWVSPGAWPIPFRSELPRLPHLARIAGTAGPASLARLMRFEQACAAWHPSEPHWYLALLGVRPDRHGHGRGGALLRHRLGIADGERTPVHLETQTAANVEYYRRFGFEPEGDPIHESGVPSWAMVRHPRG